MESKILLVILLGFVISTQAYDHYVGGKEGWGLNPSESHGNWSSRNRFQVNDTLVFKYKAGSDSVLLVNMEQFDACNVSNPIMKMDDGDSKYKLERPGSFYFISGNQTRCESGEKLIVVVLSPRGVNSPPSVPSTTPTTAPVSTPPAPAAPGSSSPMGSAPASTPPAPVAPGSSSPMGAAPASSPPAPVAPGSSSPMGAAPGSSLPAPSAPGSSSPIGAAPGSSPPAPVAPGSSSPMGAAPGSSPPAAAAPASTPPGAAPASSSPGYAPSSDGGGNGSPMGTPGGGNSQSPMGSPAADNQAPAPSSAPALTSSMGVVLGISLLVTLTLSSFVGFFSEKHAGVTEKI